jgi:hypothetical protein
MGYRGDAMSDKQSERLLTEKEAAARLKVSRSFLAKARMKGMVRRSYA